MCVCVFGGGEWEGGRGLLSSCICVSRALRGASRVLRCGPLCPVVSLVILFGLHALRCTVPPYRSSDYDGSRNQRVIAQADDVADRPLVFDITLLGPAALARFVVLRPRCRHTHMDAHARARQRAIANVCGADSRMLSSSACSHVASAVVRECALVCSCGDTELHYPIGLAACSLFLLRHCSLASPLLPPLRCCPICGVMDAAMLSHQCAYANAHAQTLARVPHPPNASDSPFPSAVPPCSHLLLSPLARLRKSARYRP